MNTKLKLLADLNTHIVKCERCPRLRKHCEKVARIKRRAYMDWDYWGKPVPGFGDPQAELLIVGLAPGAHGANRTGRMFTGDRSGDFLYKALHRAGFANQPSSRQRDDGLKLRNAYITAVARCAPPDNKPIPVEICNCRSYLEKELEILQPRAVLALGKIAFDGFLATLRERGDLPARPAFKFAHGVSFTLPGELPMLFGAYHPSQQNTQTGRLTEQMFSSVLNRIRRFLNGEQH
ncbi:MAG: uracil-DNA glycosylase [Acidobacteria bacterium]|nr:uracil-DNA glycosylase [Acidobacteriota bacterium]